MAEWEFYGRHTASLDLARRLQIHPDQPYRRTKPARFAAIGIGGRRGVGKNALLEHVAQQHGWQDRLLIVTLNDFDRDTMNAREAETLFLATLEDTIRERNLDHLCRDLVPRGDKITDAGRLIQIIRHLVYKDMIVALDEVHNILGTLLPSRLMRFIDDHARVFRGVIYATGRPPPPGKLVLMGSHQQQFARLQHAKAPLHKRFRSLQLHPWSVTTVMDIAQAHGWDRRPARFQALWTAYDGMPREWERFARGDDTPPGLSQNWEPPSGDEARDQAADNLWYKDFVRCEREIVESDTRQRWDNSAHIELPKPLRDAIIWMGAHRDPRTLVTAQDIVTGVTNTARHARMTLDPPMSTAGDLGDDMDRLNKYTQIVQERTRFIGNRDGTLQHWQLNDNTTLFQLAIAPDIFVPRYRRTPPEPLLLQAMVSALKTLEGEALERLTAAWLQGHPHKPKDVYDRAERPTPKGKKAGDIDVLGRLLQDPERRTPQDLLVLVNAKRNSHEHKVGTFEEQVTAFLAPGPPKKNKDDHDPMPEITAVRHLPRTLLFVAPSFASEARARIQAAGHLALDLNDMAAERRADWPLLRARLDRARQAAPGQVIRLVPPAPSKVDEAAIGSWTEWDEAPAAPQAKVSKGEATIETDLSSP